MLIDLPIPHNQPGTSFLLEVDTLYVRKEGPYPPTFTPEDIASMQHLPIWRRMAKGVYAAHSLDNHIDAYLDPLQVKPSDVRLRLGLAAVGRAREAGDHAEAERLLEEVFGRPHDYGRAASLEQILEYGKVYVEGPESYVLAVYPYDNTYEKSYKQGPYIGPKVEGEDHWEPDEVICFTFHEVINADGTPFAGAVWHEQAQALPTPEVAP